MRKIKLHSSFHKFLNSLRGMGCKVIYSTGKEKFCLTIVVDNKRIIYDRTSMIGEEKEAFRDAFIESAQALWPLTMGFNPLLIDKLIQDSNEKELPNI